MNPYSPPDDPSLEETPSESAQGLRRFLGGRQDWLFGTAIILGILLIGVVGSVVYPLLLDRRVTLQDRRLGALFAIVGTLFAIVGALALAFSVAALCWIGSGLFGLAKTRTCQRLIQKLAARARDILAFWR